MSTSGSARNTVLPASDDAPGRWLGAAIREGGSRWVANAATSVHATLIGGAVEPVTVLTGSPGHSSYVASPHAAWISYPFAEALSRVGGWRRTAVALAGVIAAAPLTALVMGAGLDRAALVANHLVSTNLHPRWSPQEVQHATTRLVREFPDRPLVLRSVCRGVDAALTDTLVAGGWRLVPARRIYLVDPRDAAVWRHNHLKRDRKLLKDRTVEVVGPDDLDATDLPALRAAFRQLFLGKHCALNPDYTAEFFSLCHRWRFLDLFALRHAGRPVGVLGVYERHGWVTTPLIGYDTSLPQDLGLYRRLMALLYQEAQRRGCRLHLSSGAGGFKAARGGEAHLEYTAVYGAHLGPARRRALNAFAAVMDHVVPRVLERAG
jgi:hypothetical protein